MLQNLHEFHQTRQQNQRNNGNQSKRATRATSALHNVAQHTHQYAYTHTLTHIHTSIDTNTHIRGRPSSCLHSRTYDTAPQISRLRKLFSMQLLLAMCVPLTVCVCVYVRVLQLLTYIYEKCHFGQSRCGDCGCCCWLLVAGYLRPASTWAKTAMQALIMEIKK